MKKYEVMTAALAEAGGKGKHGMRKQELSLGMPHWIEVHTEKEHISEHFQPDKAYGARRRIRVCLEGEPDTTVRVSAPGEELRFVRLRWQTNQANESRILGDAWERSYCDLAWRGVSARRPLPWYFLISKYEDVYGCGVRVQPNAFCFFEADPKGITLYMDLRCGGDGVSLGNRTLDVCTIIYREYGESGSYEAGRDFCRELCPAPLLPDRPVFGGNNWYYAYGESSREELLRDTDYLMELSARTVLPPYMVIDDGWQIRHGADYNGGPWRAGGAAYGDMEGLAADIAERGAIPGIWFRPLHNRDAAVPKSGRLDTGHLDPSVPGTLDYIREDIRTLCGWGYRLLKHDFSTYDLFGKWGFEMHPLVTDSGWHFHDQSLTGAEIVKRLYAAVREESAPFGALVLGCNAVGHLGAGLMHIMRTGDDTSGLSWERTRSVGVNTLAFRLIQNETFYMVDADCVGITEQVPWRFNRQFADVIARSGTALFLSAKPGVLSPEEKKELSEIIAMAAEGKRRAYPFDWILNDCPELWQDGNNRRIHYDWYEETGTNFDSGKRFDTPFMAGV
ncbi:alpha-galactosidase [Lachnoclostridium sp. Marseille-P6806]|uniref:alpha-galactosidase n=1 Tax=Lachnoclostridium sp. Marseille-P6806 TaxID=2364793 RepID=UPI001031F387|nr:alpha-galactosidase [Lachnoclostridium sp. Marseille-P6806]